MDENNVKLEFALGNQNSSTNFFKSSFARSFVINCRDAKSLDTKLFGMNNIEDEDENTDLKENILDDGMNNNNNYVSLMAIDNLPNRCEKNINSMRKMQSLNDAEQRELDDLRKQCQALREENRRLNNALRMHQASSDQAIDNVYLQSQIDTLQWQLKQTESNRQMYRSLMKQVVSFLERARKSLDILHANSNINKNSTRSHRCQSVYTEEQSRHQNSITSPNSTSRFTRAKSVTQISSTSACSSIRDFTWSMMRRNDLNHCTPSQINSEHQSQENINKTKYERIIHKRNNESTQMEATRDHTPPEKLSQEAFRLQRTVESLLAMREPHLTVVSSSFSSSICSSESSSSSSLSSFITSSPTTATIDDNNTLNSPIERNISLQNGKIVNSTRLHDNSHEECCTHTDNRKDNSNLSDFNKSSCSEHTQLDDSYTSSALQSHSPDSVGMIKTINTKKAEEEKEEDDDDDKRSGTVTIEIAPRQPFSFIPTSTPNEKMKRTESLENKGSNITEKPVSSLSSAEDESGFSSMSSFQDVGLPVVNSLAPIKSGCHTEIGLPEISLDKINHRRWSSTPAEIQALFKKYKDGFLSHRTSPESLSVWV